MGKLSFFQLIFVLLCGAVATAAGISPVDCPDTGNKYGPAPPAVDSEACQRPSDPNNLPKSPLEEWFTKEDFNALFPRANHGWGPHECLPYSYESFVIAARYFPEFGAGTKARRSNFTRDGLRRRDVAAFFAHAVQETGDTHYGFFNSTLPAKLAVECFYRGGLYHYHEGGPKSRLFAAGTKDGKLCKREGRYCNEAPETAYWYPCGTRNVSAGNDTAFKACYFGRGPLQLSWNYNYGLFEHFLAVRGIKVNLLGEPHLVLEKRDPPLAMLAALWFYMTPQPPKPAMHDIMMGSWKPSLKNSRAGYDGSVFGPTSFVINNECAGEVPNEEPGPPGENRRIKAFRFFARHLKAPLESDRMLSCKSMLEKFDAVPHKFSWQPDWSSTWKNQPCDCAPASYPGLLPYFDPKIYPDRFEEDNERNRLRCVFGIYQKRDLYHMDELNSPCLKNPVKIRLTKDGL